MPKKAVDSILPQHKQIDLIFAQNDRMAIGAYRSAARQGRTKDIAFVGIDAVWSEGYGVDRVAAGELDATFIYPTGGDRVIQWQWLSCKENRMRATLIYPRRWSTVRTHASCRCKPSISSN